jgi:oligosaccharide repeat unit polymerase
VTGQIAIAGAALFAFALIVALGRRDVSRPAIAFGAVWFLCVAAAQMRLTTFEHAWSLEFTAVVFGGGLTLVAAALLAAGSAPARGSVSATPSAYRPTRLVISAVALLVGGVAGLAWKATIVGGIPLFSGEIDVLRARAYGPEGEIAVPAWSTFLTNGFHLAFWCLLAALWAGWGSSSGRRVVAAFLLGAAVVGALSGGSRNLVLLLVAIPVVAAYVLQGRLSSRQKLALAGVAAIAVVGATALYLVRVHEREAGRQTFINRELDALPPPLQPLLPLYVGGVFPFEAERRLAEAVPSRFAYGNGAVTLQGLPDALFPNGKIIYADVVASLTYETTETTPYWTVATYQGRALADFGLPGVAVVSVLLGLLLGGAYRWARGHAGLFSVAVIGYVVYYAAFMVYDNFASVAAMSAAYDLLAIGVLDRIVRRAPATDPAQRTST